MYEFFFCMNVIIQQESNTSVTPNLRLHYGGFHDIFFHSKAITMRTQKLVYDVLYPT